MVFIAGFVVSKSTVVFFITIVNFFVVLSMIAICIYHIVRATIFTMAANSNQSASFTSSLFSQTHFSFSNFSSESSMCGALDV